MADGGASRRSGRLFELPRAPFESLQFQRRRARHPLASSILSLPSHSLQADGNRGPHALLSKECSSLRASQGWAPRRGVRNSIAHHSSRSTRTVKLLPCRTTRAHRDTALSMAMPRALAINAGRALSARRPSSPPCRMSALAIDSRFAPLRLYFMHKVCETLLILLMVKRRSAISLALLPPPLPLRLQLSQGTREEVC